MGDGARVAVELRGPPEAELLIDMAGGLHEFPGVQKDGGNLLPGPAQTFFGEAVAGPLALSPSPKFTSRTAWRSPGPPPP
jgi:hypothetical protein